MKLDLNEASMEILREVCQHVHDPVFLADTNLNVWYFNRAFETAVGVRLHSRKYKHMTCCELLNLEICETNCILRSALESGEPTRLGEINGRTLGGEPKNFYINAVPVFSAAERPIGALIFLRDMSVETRIFEKYKRLVAADSRISVSGRIEGGNFPDIVQLFSFLQKTGTLKLTAGELQGRVQFSEGKMVAIAFNGCRGEKALGRLVDLEEAGFSFEPGADEESEEHLEVSGEFALMNALREKDELAARSSMLPAPSARIYLLADLEDQEGLSDLEAELLDGIRNGASREQMVERMEAPDKRVCLSLIDLHDRQLITW